ncbi:MAG: DNA polymerase I [Candidatus Omnitrophota bacterium]
MLTAKEKHSDLFIIDANALCYRAFFALPALTNTKGMPTGAIYGFVNMLNKFLEGGKYGYIAACFDVSRDTFRQRKFSDYKIQRPKMPDDLVNQLTIIKKILAAFNISIFEYQGYEADDLIATLCKKSVEEGLNVKILTADKDLLQLISSKVSIIIPHKEKNILYDEKEVLNRFGVSPKLIPEVIALMGDATDNIPGVKGIGEKTAISLIKQYDNIENLLENIDSLKPQRVADLIKKDTNILNLSRELVELEDCVPLDFNLRDLELKTPNYKELFDIYKELEFRTFLKDLPIKDDELSNLNIAVNKESTKGYDKLRELIFISTPDNDSNYNFYTFIDENNIFKTDSPERLKSLFENVDINKIGFDLKQEFKVSNKLKFNINGKIFDVMIAAYLIDSSKTDFSLGGLIYDYLGLTVRNASPEKNLVLIARLYEVLRKKIEENNMESLFYDIEMPLVKILAKMEINGIALDLKLINSLSKDIEYKINGLENEIFTNASKKFNLNSPKQLAVILFQELGLPVIKRGKTGPSTNEFVLKQLSKDYKIAKLILEYRHLIKLKTGYIDSLPELVDKNTNRIHAYFNQVGTETGRLSMNNPNLQNIPIKTDISSQLRKAFVPKNKEDFIVSCDYSQIELRILAHMSKDKELTQAFKNGEDVHLHTAGLIYGVDKKNITADMRNVAKRINFAIVYGMSAYGLSQDLEINQDAAQSFIDTYFIKYNGVKEFIEKQIEFAKNNGFVTTIFGRKRFIREINSQNKSLREFSQRQAINSPIQGSSADIIKIAMINIDKEFDKEQLLSKMILQIHDELLFEVNNKELDLVKRIARDRMENVFKLDVPIKIDIKIGKNWLDA